VRDNYTLFQLQRQFIENALSAPDQLRQRVAFALSQIVVISGNTVTLPYAMREYQQMLLSNAFGNYRAILGNVTLSPAMGRYLNMVNNDKPSSPDVSPNENYARELLQLFSIGLVTLQGNGMPVLDSTTNLPVPSYDQNVIKGFAHVFTGWTYPTQPGKTFQRHNPQYYIGPMEVDPNNHDTGAKTLFPGMTLAAGQAPEKDLGDALDAVFNHPNVGHQ
jgi:uncharacterized protein (DUF1800 family)